jgi:hypothetical protein
MTFNNRTNLGRSPDADEIYDQYTAYYAANNADIYAIDQLPLSIWNQAYVQQDRTLILSCQTQLGAVYQRDYADDHATLASFQRDAAEIQSRVQTAYNDAMGGGSVQQRIQQDYSQAQNIATVMAPSIQQDTALLNCAAGLQAAIASLQTQISALPAGPARTKAQNDLNQAQADLLTLQTAVGNAFPTLSTLQQNLQAALNQLSALAAKSDPTQDDLTQADLQLATMRTIQSNLATFEQGPLQIVASRLGVVNGDIQTVRTDIQPTPPPPVPGKIEHACWYIDWSSWDFPIPQGVDTVHIFVGKLMIGPDGKPTVGGFGNMTLDKLDTFVQNCKNHNPPISVKISIGGGGGSYDKCWDELTPDNVDAYAQGLVDFCHTHGLAGIDFDYEEYAGPDQEILVGTLIRKFKALDPTLKTSLCTNAGFGPSYPWQAVVKYILEAAIDQTSGTCAVDRLYIMSYYQPLEDEKQWMLGWAQWLSTNYGFTPAQVTFGIDDFDAHAYDIGEASKWAASQGFSTGYWAWNPATQAASDQSTLKIAENYVPPVNLTLTQGILCFLAVLFGPITALVALISLAFSSKERPAATTLVAKPSAPLLEPSEFIQEMQQEPSAPELGLVN